MKKNILRLTMVAALVVILGLINALAASPAVARTNREDIENDNVNCSVIEPPKAWIEDGVLHIRDQVMEGFVDSNRDYHRGMAINVANANIDLATGYREYWGTLEINPDAYPDGHWAGSWSMQVNEGHIGGVARLRGYGELDGLLAKSEIAPLTEDQLPDWADECECEGPDPCPVSGAHAVGYVMFPGGE